MNRLLEENFIIVKIIGPLESLLIKNAIRMKIGDNKRRATIEKKISNSLFVVLSINESDLSHKPKHKLSAISLTLMSAFVNGELSSL